ncbi:MAG: GNAT family N-acetyltransferase [Candidatus Marinimicrobia bacterium]|nr:GNAT family N-acetyltransferase [Candidatus Neomarinimicrobiota bacterium]MDD5583308.1 GNAT family N-acetyltransferase [Candidatus Neomarinimicrobiota bacterium]
MKDMITIKPIRDVDRIWLPVWISQRWRTETLVFRGEKNAPAELPGFIAFIHKMPVGVITYSLKEDVCQIISLDTVVHGKGIGDALLEKVLEVMREKNIHHIKMLTTNDNLKRMEFLERNGFKKVKVYEDEVVKYSRKVKPEIQPFGYENLPIRDEIEYLREI